MYTLPPYLLLVQQPAVCLQAAVNRWWVDLGLALGRLHRAGHSLQHVHGGGAQDPGHAVIEPRGQHRVQDWDLLLGQSGRLMLGARRPETCLLHHPHQLVLHILGRRVKHMRLDKRWKRDIIWLKLRVAVKNVHAAVRYLYCKESRTIEEVLPTVGHFCSLSLSPWVLPPDNTDRLTEEQVNRK